MKTSVRPCYPPAHLLRNCQLPLSWEPHSVQGCAVPSWPAPPALRGLRSSLPSPAEFQPRASTPFLRHTRVSLHTQYSRTGRLHTQRAHRAPYQPLCPGSASQLTVFPHPSAPQPHPSSLCTTVLYSFPSGPLFQVVSRYLSTPLS